MRKDDLAGLTVEELLRKAKADESARTIKGVITLILIVVMPLGGLIWGKEFAAAVFVIGGLAIVGLIIWWIVILLIGVTRLARRQ